MSLTDYEREPVQMADELHTTWALLVEALPLALRTLKSGDATLFEQSAFWVALDKLQTLVDVFDDIDEIRMTAAVFDRMGDWRGLAVYLKARDIA